jgi:hypothetical protein
MWSERALRACLDTLQNSITEGKDIQVVAAWADTPSSLCIVYRCPWFTETIGFRASNQDPDMWGGTPEDPEDFGGMLADFELGDPWIVTRPPLVRGPDGVHWWGEIDEGIPVRPPSQDPQGS